MNLFSLSRRKLPLVMQEANGECGLACIAMVAQWHGHKLDLPYLRGTYPTTRRGLSLANLAAIADQLRFDVRGYQVDDTADLGKVRLPALLHWGKNHFVVLKSVRRGVFTIHNPAAGVCRYTAEELAEHFSGYVLELAPGQTFETIVRAKKYTLQKILELTDGLKASLTQIILVSVVASLLVMLLPILVQVALDSVLPRSDFDLLGVLSAGLMLVMLTVGLAQWLQKRIVANAGSAFFAQLTRNAVGHIFRLPLRYFESRHPGDIATRLDSVDSIRNVVTKSFVAGTVDIIMILFSGTIMFLYAPMLAAIVSALFLVVVAVRVGLYPSLRRQGTLSLKFKSEERARLIDNPAGTTASSGT
jgi:ATP-binding cassette subfamily B protein RaxB